MNYLSEAEATTKMDEPMCLHEINNRVSRSYVVSAGSKNLVMVTTNNQRMMNWFQRVFLPQGYPESVSEDYLPYQIWDTAQAFCSTIAGTLATQEVLRGVGVGDAGASALAATVTWVLRDGAAHAARILFACTHGTHLDAYSKKWRLVADVLNDVAMFVEVMLPRFGELSLAALCFSSGLKAVVGVAGGATRVAMTQHHAVKGNLGDVAAKDAAQETAVNLVASLVALLIISCLGSSVALFSAAVALHVACNYRAVRAVRLRTLNEPRYLLVLERYLRRRELAAPARVNSLEPIVFYGSGPNSLDEKICGFKIRLGSSVCDAFGAQPDTEVVARALQLFRDKCYVVAEDAVRGIIHVVLQRTAAADDVLAAYYHAVLLAAALRTRAARPQARRGDPEELPQRVNAIVDAEWPSFRNALQKTGWDVSTHLLVTGPWRVARSPAAGAPAAATSPHPAHQRDLVQVPEDSVHPRADTDHPPTHASHTEANSKHSKKQD